MVKRKLSKNQQFWYWLVLGGLCAVSLLIIAVVTSYNRESINQRYYQPFESRAKGSSVTTRSSTYQPSAPGLRESNIQKHRGSQYATY